MGKKKVLAYGFGEQEKALLEAMASVGVETRLVKAEELELTIGALLSGEGPASCGVSEDPAVLVFSNVSREELEPVLRAIREAGITALKAMETPTNRTWPLKKLMGELAEEHRTMSALMDLKRVRDSVTPNLLDPACMGALARADALLKGQAEPTVTAIMEARMALERYRGN